MSAHRQPAPLLVKLQINTTDAWRDVLLFDFGNIHEVMTQAPHLFSMAFDKSVKGLSLRVIASGEVSPIATWKADSGWTSWEL